MYFCPRRDRIHPLSTLLQRKGILRDDLTGGLVKEESRARLGKGLVGSLSRLVLVVLHTLIPSPLPPVIITAPTVAILNDYTDPGYTLLTHDDRMHGGLGGLGPALSDFSFLCMVGIPLPLLKAALASSVFKELSFSSTFSIFTGIVLGPAASCIFSLAAANKSLRSGSSCMTCNAGSLDSVASIVKAILILAPASTELKC